jgi:hypothetical protein
MSPSAADLVSAYVHYLLEGIEKLRQELKELKWLIFGSKKERFVPCADPGQLSLELGQEKAVTTLVKQTAHYQRVVEKVKREAAPRKPIRQPLPAHLSRITIYIEPKEDVIGMRKIGEEITEELDLKPAYLFVRRYVRPRYVSREETFHIGEFD